jgi:murein DD-endopeptidase MepM/ murein hydrolase activator NlpD
VIPIEDRGMKRNIAFRSAAAARCAAAAASILGSWCVILTMACGSSKEVASPTAPSSGAQATQTGEAAQEVASSPADARLSALAVAPDASLKSRLFCPANLIGPCIGYGVSISQGYLNYNSVNPTPDDRHAGIDFGGTQTVYSPVAGLVLATGNCGSVVIEDARRVVGGSSTAPRHIMLHMKGIKVSKGQTVRVGTVLGVSSNVSYSAGGCIATGAHLHYEIRRNYAGVLAVGPTSCAGNRNCTTATLTYDPLSFPF